MSDPIKGFDTPLEHLKTFRINRKHIPNLGPGFHYMKAHWMSVEFLRLTDDLDLSEEEWIDWANSGQGYNLEVYEVSEDKIDSIDKFKDAQQKHLKALEDIRNFIFGDENNQPQVTYCPKMSEFDKHYLEVKAWIETSQFEEDNND